MFWSRPSSSLATSMPDMNASRSIFTLSQVHATAWLLDAVARRNECVSLVCEPGFSTAALLDLAETELSIHHLRCVRIYGPASGGLALRDLIAQIVGQANPDALTDDDLRAGFVTLTEPGEGSDRVVLLVTEAHNLQPSALHYVQFACCSSPKLRVVLAGQPSLTTILAEPDFAQLRQRVTSTFELPGPVQDKAPAFLAGMPDSSPVPEARHPSVPTPLVRMGLFASLVLLIGVIGWRHMPTPAAPAVYADAPALSDQVALTGAPPPVPARDMPVAQPEAVQAEQERADAIEKELAGVFPPESDPSDQAAPALAEAIPASTEHPSLEQVPAPSGDMLSAQLYEPSGTAGEPVENDTAVHDEAPVASASVSTLAPEQNAEADAPHPPEPVAASAPDPVPPPQPAAPASPPFSPPPPIRKLAIAVPSVDASPARSIHGRVKPAAAPGAPLPNHPIDGQHCRDIVLHVQLGKDLSDADKQFLRDDCRAK